MRIRVGDEVSVLAAGSERCAGPLGNEWSKTKRSEMVRWERVSSCEPEGIGDGKPKDTVQTNGRKGSTNDEKVPSISDSGCVMPQDVTGEM